MANPSTAQLTQRRSLHKRHLIEISEILVEPVSRVLLCWVQIIYHNSHQQHAHRAYQYADHKLKSLPWPQRVHSCRYQCSRSSCRYNGKLLQSQLLILSQEECERRSYCRCASSPGHVSTRIRESFRGSPTWRMSGLSEHHEQ